MKTTIQNTYPGFKTDLGDISLAFGSNWIVRIQILPSIFVKKNARHSLCNLLSRHPSNKNKPGKHLKKKKDQISQSNPISFQQNSKPHCILFIKKKENKQTNVLKYQRGGRCCYKKCSMEVFWKLTKDGREKGESLESWLMFMERDGKRRGRFNLNISSFHPQTLSLKR